MDPGRPDGAPQMPASHPALPFGGIPAASSTTIAGAPAAEAESVLSAPAADPGDMDSGPVPPWPNPSPGWSLSEDASSALAGAWASIPRPPSASAICTRSASSLSCRRGRASFRSIHAPKAQPSKITPRRAETARIALSAWVSMIWLSAARFAFRPSRSASMRLSTRPRHCPASPRHSPEAYANRVGA
jgi:hypothetical protein